MKNANLLFGNIAPVFKAKFGFTLKPYNYTNIQGKKSRTTYSISFDVNERQHYTFPASNKVSILCRRDEVLTIIIKDAKYQTHITLFLNGICLFHQF